MDKTTLQQRINDKEAKIAKIKRSLEKNLKDCNTQEKEAINYYLETGDTSKFRKYLKANNKCYGGDAWSRAIDLYEARLTLQKYLNQLKALESRESITKIDIIWKFLLQYKDMVINWLQDNAKYVHLYLEANTKYCNMYNSHKYTIEELKEQDRIERKYKSEIHPLTSRYYSSRRGWDMEGLNKILNQDIESRYFKLINQVTKYTGEILDASNLSIKSGELNGVISGKNGKAHIFTIGAGGYNIQCFHYRTLVHRA